VEKDLMARKKPAVGSAKKSSAPAPASTSDVMPASYVLALEQIKDRIRSAQLKAAVTLNRELIELYWDIGKQIVERQQAEAWAAASSIGSPAICSASFPAWAGSPPATSGACAPSISRTPKGLQISHSLCEKWTESVCRWRLRASQGGTTSSSSNG
jgi:hypothetical protein